MTPKLSLRLTPQQHRQGTRSPKLTSQRADNGHRTRWRERTKSVLKRRTKLHARGFSLSPRRYLKAEATGTPASGTCWGGFLRHTTRRSCSTATSTPSSLRRTCAVSFGTLTRRIRSTSGTGYANNPTMWVSGGVRVGRELLLGRFVIGCGCALVCGATVLRFVSRWRSKRNSPTR